MEHIRELAILVVDDQPIINEFYRKILETLGCKRIYSALSGQEAIQRLAERGDINLVLTDIDMQPGNGLELLQAIRCGDIDNTPRDLCVLVVSDYNYRHNVMKAVGLDCHGFLSKPLNAEVLSAKVHAALHRQIDLAPSDTYRGISTEIKVSPAVASYGNLVAHKSRPTESSPAGPVSAPAAVPQPDLKPPTPSAEPAVEPQPETPPTLPQSDPQQLQKALEQAASALLPVGIQDSFLHYKHDTLREILHLLYQVGESLAESPPEEIHGLIEQIEQLSTDLFQQEYLHQREHGYQPVSAHQAEHGLILQRTQMLTGKLYGRRKDRVLKAYQQLREAWYRHISVKDQQYVEFLQHQVGIK